MSNLKHCDKCDHSFLSEDGHDCPAEPRGAWDVVPTEMAESLPIGTRIRFTKTLESGPDDHSPGNLYAKNGDLGEITGYGCKEGYWVKWDRWEAPFGASRDEFEPVRGKQ